MSEWKKVKLGDISLNIQTGPFGSQLHQSDYEDTGVPVIMPKDIINGKICDDTIARIPSDLSSKLLKYQVEFEDIIYPRRGDISKCAIVGKSQIGWLCGTGCLKISIDKSLAKSKFIYYELQLPKQIGWIINHAIGATMLNLNTNILRNVPIDLPSINIQNRIIEILFRYDSLIENYQKQIKLLEESAQRLYKEWFVDLRFPGYENTKIVNGMPEGWEKKKLIDFTNIIMGQSPKSEFYNNDKIGLPFHQGVGSFGSRFVVDNVYSSCFSKIADSKSILFSVRAPVGRINITNNKVAIGRGLASINHKKGFQSFLYYLLKSFFFKENIIGNGAIFASISKEDLYNLLFLIPDEKLVIHFNKVASNIDREIKSISDQINFLIEVRDRLLSELMNGKLFI